MKPWFQVRLVPIGNDPFEVWGQVGEGWSIDEAIAAANPYIGQEYQLLFRSEMRVVIDE